MEFRLLGPVEAWSTGRRIDVGPRKQRLMLAHLALRVNKSVQVDQLVDLTWPCAPPRTARHAIHVQVSRLRTVFAEVGGREPQIATRGSTYSLHADPMSVDVHRFRALVGAARAEATDADKLVLLRRALGMWHGPPLADVAAPATDELCRGLEESRLAVWEESLDIEVRLGQHGTIVDELFEFVDQHPHRQHVIGLLMLVLYRNGRAPEALRIYRRERTLLAEEFGLDPHPRLQQLERAILRADPSLEPPSLRSSPRAGHLPKPTGTDGRPTTALRHLRRAPDHDADHVVRFAS